MNFLKGHIDRATEQKSNQHSLAIKTVSFNQVKCDDLSIKRPTTKDTEALRHLAKDWEQSVGNGALMRISIYGVLGHHIRTSSMNMNHVSQIREDLSLDNMAFISTADVKYIGWLIQPNSKKTASLVVVTSPRANGPAAGNRNGSPDPAEPDGHTANSGNRPIMENSNKAIKGRSKDRRVSNHGSKSRKAPSNSPVKCVPPTSLAAYGLRSPPTEQLLHHHQGHAEVADTDMVLSLNASSSRNDIL
ncbi:hypothetical protein CORC01_10828 [Colletotrichum orchidophilum]|uniref:Uncharacterized protein n=1 Tax=Colletotrichum orchidophilum TaxID=1209926 RepID=A0A1G4AXP2_9PEZI|nr:uncharacterized protein CORC01_10828 [Colletotrichum orchidophilum]OHE93929.1 hypothetical protein CORC01_10828 [Colletotrichum orchidophilum]